MSRRHNLNLLKADWPYRREELAHTLSVTLGTISKWTKAGLKPVDWQRPYLYRGDHVNAFLAARAKPRQPLGPGELYCTPCKKPSRPQDDIIKLVERSATTVDFSGPCNVCGHQMYRRVRIAEIADKLGTCTIAYKDD
jgi:hypothetical protein